MFPSFFPWVIFFKSVLITEIISVLITETIDIYIKTYVGVSNLMFYAQWGTRYALIYILGRNLTWFSMSLSANT